MSTPAGWYPDPQQQGQLRYWDGATWTEHQAPAQGAAPAAGDQGQGGQGQAGGYGAASVPQQGADYGVAPAPGTADQTSPYGTGADPAMQYGTQHGGFGPSQPGADPSAYGADLQRVELNAEEAGALASALQGVVG